MIEPYKPAWSCSNNEPHKSHDWKQSEFQLYRCPGMPERMHTFVTADRPEIESARLRQCTMEMPHLWHYNSDNTMCNGLAVKKELSEVDHPAHYGGDTTYEVIKVHEAWSEMFGLSFLVLNAIKYLTRAGRKPGTDAMTDLKKAAWYIEREMNRLERIEADKIG